MVVTPLELLEKLAALVPRPKNHLVRYHGILAPAAKWRASIVPAAAAANKQSDSLSHSGCCPPSGSPANPSMAVPPAPSQPRPLSSPAEPRLRYYTWPELMRRIFEIDVLECPRCHGRLRIIAVIHPPDATRKILDWLALPSRPPPLAPALPAATTPLHWAEDPA